MRPTKAKVLRKMLVIVTVVALALFLFGECSPGCCTLDRLALGGPRR